jgi:DNA mismatch endonuclease, patch repair protein
VARDRAADAALGAAGWSVVRIWEHESLEAAVTAVVAALDATGRPSSGRPLSAHRSDKGQDAP